ncbi:SRPBCC family protein [Novispirillum sp. DQ9]|uniref:SRPBCC family protein n=1 Tax=Novispirillum sp. DQ9 TaxID=3398612 RepID=UPI003C7C2E3C
MTQTPWDKLKDDPARMAGMVGGGSLAAWGLRRGGLMGLSVAAIGGALAWRAATGKPVLSGLSTLGGATVVRRAIHVDRPRAEVWRFWRDQENLARFMHTIQHIERRSETRYHWTVRGPLDMPLDWDCEVDATPENERVAWHTLPGAEVHSEGEVLFTDSPGGGTLVKVALRYKPPAGQSGRLVASLLGAAPEQQLDDDLRRFKVLMESGGTESTLGGGGI